MKNNLILLLLSVCFSSSILQAQELSQSYLYDEFKDGLVLFKDGRRFTRFLADQVYRWYPCQCVRF
jgi:hypothetical protein